MPTNDSPSALGATNVLLNQRSSVAPYHREAVGIQGDEHPGKAIGFDSAGRLSTLAVIVGDPVSVKAFGAKGDSVTDDTAAILLAMAHPRVHFPGLEGGNFYKISTSLIGRSDQMITGDGYASYIKQTGLVQNVFTFEGKSNFVLANVRTFATGDQPGNPFVHCCVYLGNCSQGLVENVWVQNYGCHGVSLQGGTHHCTVRGCIDLGAAVIPPHNDTAAFGAFWNASWNLFEGCFATGPTGSFGIHVVSNMGGSANHNTILGCYAANKTRYGIILYSGDSPTPEVNHVRDNAVIGCTVDNITGDYENPLFPGQKPYGMGIYLCAAHGTTVSDNKISRCNLMSTDNSVLPLGGISINGCDGAFLSNNQVRNCAHNGITIIDANHNGVGNILSIVGGNVNDNGKHGIYIAQQHRVSVDSVGLNGNTLGGLLCGGLVGAYNEGIVVKGCTFAHHTTYDVYFTCTSFPIIVNNCFTGPAALGIRIMADVQAAIVSGNQFYATKGILCASAGCLISGNAFVGCATGIDNPGGSIITGNRFESNGIDCTGLLGVPEVTTHGAATTSGLQKATKLHVGAGLVEAIPAKITGVDGNVSGVVASLEGTGPAGGFLHMTDNATAHWGLGVKVGGQFALFSNRSAGSAGVEMLRITGVAAGGLEAGSLVVANGMLNLKWAYPPASATAPGVAGTVTWDPNYLFVCTATNVWKRAALSTWP